MVGTRTKIYGSHAGTREKGRGGEVEEWERAIRFVLREAEHR